MAAFTTIATAVGLGMSATTAGMSFANASKQARLQRQAEADAAKAMAEARNKLEVNFYDQLAVKKEPYELEREAALAAGAQAIEAGKESERGATATAGRIQMAQTDQQRQIASAMGDELSNLEKLSATEDSRLRDVGVQLDLGEAEGAQQAAADAQKAKATAITQGMQSVGELAQQSSTLLHLYEKNRGKQIDAMGQMSWSQDDYAKFKNVPSNFGMGDAVQGGSNLDFDAIKNMSKSQYSQFMKTLTPEQRKMLFTNPQFINNFNNIDPFKF
jgi:hypothetical protein